MNDFKNKLDKVLTDKGYSISWLEKMIGSSITDETDITRELLLKICWALEVTPTYFNVTLTDLAYMSLEAEKVENVIELHKELSRLWIGTKAALEKLNGTWPESWTQSMLLSDKVKSELIDSFKFNRRLITLLSPSSESKELRESYNELLSDFIEATGELDMVWYYFED